MDTDDARELIAEIVDDDELLSSMDVELTELTDESLSLFVPYSDRIALAESTPGMGGAVHAGVVATLIDMSGEVLRLAADDPRTFVLATTDLNVSYLRPASGDLHVTATIRRVGSSMAVSEATVESETPEGDRKEIAVGRTSYRVLETDG